MRRCYVYQICKPGMSLQEGYVGVSQDPDYRFKQHKGSECRVGEYIRNNEDVFCKTILVSDRLTCLQVEAKLRPERDIGLNVEAGGVMPPTQWKNKHTLGHRKGTHPGRDIQANKVRGRTKENDEGARIRSEKMKLKTKLNTSAIMNKALRQTDFTKHDFYHDEYGHVRTHARKLCDDYKLESGNIFNILRGKGKTVKGWRLTQ